MHQILWVDDDADDLEMFCDAMHDVTADAHVIPVHNGTEALAYLERNEGGPGFPCLMVLDLNMPGPSGRDTLTRLKTSDRFRNLPVIVFTTSSSSLDRLFCEKFGVEMITKPVELGVLRDLSRKLLQVCQASPRK